MPILPGRRRKEFRRSEDLITGVTTPETLLGRVIFFGASGLTIIFFMSPERAENISIQA